jgi:hypothetical protein
MREIYSDGSVVCEIDDVSGGSTIDRVIVAKHFYLPTSTYKETDTLCPAGYTPTGGGFLAYPTGTILGSLPTANGWRIVHENNVDIAINAIAVVNCIKIVAP